MTGDHITNAASNSPVRTERPPPRYGCPECGSEGVHERNTVYIDYRVTGWTGDGTPENYDEGEIDFHWVVPVDSQPDFTRYSCSACLANFDEPKRLTTG